MPVQVGVPVVPVLALVTVTIAAADVWKVVFKVCSREISIRTLSTLCMRYLNLFLLLLLLLPISPSLADLREPTLLIVAESVI